VKKKTTTPLERKLHSLQSRVDRINALAGFLTKHPFIADISVLKPTSNGLIGLLINEKALIRPQGLNKLGLRMELWSEDAFTELNISDRVICEDVSQFSTEQLNELLATIPGPSDSEDAVEEIVEE
jgi:hypothetical protein